MLCVITSYLRWYQLPLVVVAGIFGMNNTDAPVEVPFWSVIGWTFVFCSVFFVIIVGWQTYLKRRRRKLREELLANAKPTKVIMGNLTLNLETTKKTKESVPQLRSKDDGALV